MSSHCILCDRSFDKDESLQQHLRDSPAHISSCHCEACNRSFSSEEALEQHLRDSPFHAPTFNCETCDRSFGDDGALEQHLRDSPVHARTFSCETCDRSFRGQEALEQHLRDSPVHTTSFDCESCDRSFISEEALEQHLRDSPAHAPSFNCETCDRSFVSEDALKQHLRDSSIHRQTPLDVFFRSFPTFDYDRFLPPAASYANLQKHEGLRRGQPESKAAWNDYQHALREELEMWFGAEDDLTAWHALCLAIGIEPLPKTCGQCEQAARRTHVNIIDLIEWGRSDTRERVHTFRNVDELRAYTWKTGKVFRNTLDEEDGNVVLRHLLRKIFRGRLQEVKAGTTRTSLMSTKMNNWWVGGSIDHIE